MTKIHRTGLAVITALIAVLIAAAGLFTQVYAASPAGVPGIDVQVTELDISTEGGKFSLDQQATKYKAIFQHAMEWNQNHPNGPHVTLVQVWGPNDNNSWVATDKSTGKSNAPLLYNGNNQPKSAYNAVTSIVPDSQWGIGLPYTGPGGGTYTPPTYEERIRLCADYAKKLCDYYDEHTGIRMMRGLASYYMDGMPYSAKTRAACSTAETLPQFNSILDAYLEKLNHEQ